MSTTHDSCADCGHPERSHHNCRTMTDPMYNWRGDPQQDDCDCDTWCREPRCACEEFVPAGVASATD